MDIYLFAFTIFHSRLIQALEELGLDAADLVDDEVRTIHFEPIS